MPNQIIQATTLVIDGITHFQPRRYKEERLYVV